jgi:hypothetical protein
MASCNNWQMQPFFGNTIKRGLYVGPKLIGSFV